MNGMARTAGLLYLIVIVSGMFGLAYVPSQFAAYGDSAATVQRIMQSPALFRWGILADLTCYVAFLLLPLALYRLLAASDRRAAMLMVAFAVASVPIGCLNEMHRMDVLSLLGNQGALQAFTATQVQVQVMQSLAAYHNGLLVLEIFWGVWLWPLGYLVFRCGFLPRVLGVLLMAGCVGYLVDFLGRLFFAGYPHTSVADYATLPSAAGEIGTGLWLLLMGARRTAWRAGPSVQAS